MRAVFTSFESGMRRGPLVVSVLDGSDGSSIVLDRIALRAFQLNGLIVAGQEVYRVFGGISASESALLRKFPACVRESPHQV